ncbi:MAG: hypothetical protein MHM6MM_006262 [Cercozoa sp. M6MM]
MALGEEQGGPEGSQLHYHFVHIHRDLTEQFVKVMRANGLQIFESELASADMVGDVTKNVLLKAIEIYDNGN